MWPLKVGDEVIQPELFKQLSPLRKWNNGMGSENRRRSGKEGRLFNWISTKRPKLRYKRSSLSLFLVIPFSDRRFLLSSSRVSNHTHHFSDKISPLIWVNVLDSQKIFSSSVSHSILPANRQACSLLLVPLCFPPRSTRSTGVIWAELRLPRAPFRHSRHYYTWLSSVRRSSLPIHSSPVRCCFINTTAFSSVVNQVSTVEFNRFNAGRTVLRARAWPRGDASSVLLCFSRALPDRRSLSSSLPGKWKTGKKCGGEACEETESWVQTGADSIPEPSPFVRKVHSLDASFQSELIFGKSAKIGILLSFRNQTDFVVYDWISFFVCLFTDGSIIVWLCCPDCHSTPTIQLLFSTFTFPCKYYCIFLYIIDFSDPITSSSSLKQMLSENGVTSVRTLTFCKVYSFSHE